jgi:predicted Zn-dependent protease
MRNAVIFVVSIFFFVFSGCAVNPVTGRNQLMLMGEIENDVGLGRSASAEVVKEYSQGDVPVAVSNYVNYVGQKIGAASHFPELEWNFAVLNNETVNAFALPGGYIYITTTMLGHLKNEAQLAAILAHEAVHVTARHSASSISRQTAIGAVISIATTDETASAMRVASIVADLDGLGYSRAHEKESDAYGLDYMVKAGYDPYAMVEVMEILEETSKSRPIEFLSTHPSPANRKEVIKRVIAEKGYAKAGFTGEDGYNKIVRQLKMQK